MAFTGNEDHSILIEEASALTSRYRAQLTMGGKIGGFFGKAAIESILDQQDCVGIRYYYGLTEEDEQVLVLIGVDEDENDLVEGVVCEFSVACPPNCGSSNDLNS